MSTALKEIETVQTIVTWVIGIMTPIVVALTLAVVSLWKRGNSTNDSNKKELADIHEKHIASLRELTNEHKEEVRELWSTTFKAFTEQGKVLERLVQKVEGNDQERLRENT